jgi:methionyl-tRNA formyltransferase
MDGGIDTGPIIAQKAVALSEAATFAATYEVLMECAVELFGQQWPRIRQGAFETRPQDPRQATRHYVRDLPAELLPQGWNTPIPAALALRARGLG